jgi:crotonobetainyl-CoA:carnitine CoA-transferase CaiB-like acyl-CoA transferase
MHHPSVGTVNVVGQPVHLERTPQPGEMRLATPELGGNTDEVLAEIGYDQTRIDDLRARGVV